jgi:hypothetical protein
MKLNTSIRLIIKHRSKVTQTLQLEVAPEAGVTDQMATQRPIVICLIQMKKVRVRKTIVTIGVRQSQVSHLNPQIEDLRGIPR